MDLVLVSPVVPSVDEGSDSVRSDQHNRKAFRVSSPFFGESEVVNETGTKQTL